MTDQQPKPQQRPKQSYQHEKPKQLPVRAVTGTTEPAVMHSSSLSQCVACHKGRHSIQRCEAFGALTPEKRRDLAMKAGICFNCLHPGHRVRECQSRGTCQVCRSNQHHTLLHLVSAPTTDGAPTNTNMKALVTYCDTEGEPSILSTAMFHAYYGRLQQEGRALLDSGSVPSLITERLADQLRLTRTPCQKSFTCASGNLLSSDNKVTINLMPTNKTLPDESVAVICRVVKKLPNTIAPDVAATVLEP